MAAELPEGVSVGTLGGEVKDRFVRLRAPLGIESFGLNKMVMEPGERNRIHRHTLQEEVYLVLSGELGLVLEGVEHRFGVGEIVRVAPGVRRQLVNRGPGVVELLVIGSMVDRPHQPRDAEPFADWSDAEPGDLHSVPLPENLPASEVRG